MAMHLSDAPWLLLTGRGSGACGERCDALPLGEDHRRRKEGFRFRIEQFQDFGGGADPSRVPDESRIWHAFLFCHRGAQNAESHRAIRHRR